MPEPQPCGAPNRVPTGAMIRAVTHPLHLGFLGSCRTSATVNTASDTAQPPAPRPILPLARYRVRFRERAPERTGSLNSPQADYLGSAWRGVFGRALRNTVCVTRLPACDPCALLGSCPYPFLFESRTPPGAKKLTRYPNTPGPYVLEPADPRFDTQGGEHGPERGPNGPKDRTLNLGVTLFGPANDHLPYVVHALDRAGRQGLTARRVRLEMVDVQAAAPGPPEAGAAEPDAVGDDAPRARNGGWTTIFEPGGRLSPVPARCPAPPPSPSPAVRVRLLTPLRMRRQGRFVGAADLDFRAFASSLLRRVSLLTYFFSDTPLETDFAGLLRRAESVPITTPALRWYDWTRHSSRQRADVPMGGVVGSFELPRPGLDPFWALLWLGQWTHVGRGCSMGLGRYVLEPAGVGEAGSSEAGAAPGADRAPWPAPSRL